MPGVLSKGSALQRQRRYRTPRRRRGRWSAIRTRRRASGIFGIVGLLTFVHRSGLRSILGRSRRRESDIEPRNSTAAWRHRSATGLTQRLARAPVFDFPWMNEGCRSCAGCRSRLSLLHCDHREEADPGPDGSWTQLTDEDFRALPRGWPMKRTRAAMGVRVRLADLEAGFRIRRTAARHRFRLASVVLSRHGPLARQRRAAGLMMALERADDATA